MDTTHTNNVMPSLTNPFDTQGNDQSPSTDYQAAVARGAELQALPQAAASSRNIQRQHSKKPDDGMGTHRVFGR